MIIREFSDWELQKMSEENRKSEWEYKKSAYRQYKEYMESLGYKELENERDTD